MRSMLDYTFWQLEKTMTNLEDIVNNILIEMLEFTDKLINGLKMLEYIMGFGFLYLLTSMFLHYILV